MATKHQPMTRIKGKQSIDSAVQEMAWAANVPLGRIDWQPDPELEQGRIPANSYLLTVTTNGSKAQGQLPGMLVERIPDGRDADLKKILDRLVGELRRQQH